MELATVELDSTELEEAELETTELETVELDQRASNDPAFCPSSDCKMSIFSVHFHVL